LQTFQNVLSRHILIEKLEFRALFEKAVYNTLRLILQPETALVGFFFAGKESISTAAYDKYVRYFSDFDFAVAGISAYHKREGLTTMERAMFVEKFRRIVSLYEQKHGRSVAAYRDDLFVHLTGKRPDEYGFDSVASSSVPASAYVPPRTDAAPRAEAIRPETNIPPRTDTGRADAVRAETPIPPRTDTPRAVSGPLPVHEPVKRVVDGFAKPVPPREEPLSLDSIPIHKQFQFVQKIFAGSNAKFKETLDAVGRCGSWQEAEEFLQTRVLNLPGVSKDDRVVDEFLRMIRHRFGIRT
jgi:hypothetical protein